MDIACSYCQIPINAKKDTWFYIHEPGKPDTSAHQLRFQFSTGGELAYRKPGWETGIGFDWGRVASYSRTSLSFRVALVR